MIINRKMLLTVPYMFTRTAVKRLSRYGSIVVPLYTDVQPPVKKRTHQGSTVTYNPFSKWYPADGSRTQALLRMGMTSESDVLMQTLPFQWQAVVRLFPVAHRWRLVHLLNYYPDAGRRTDMPPILWFLLIYPQLFDINYRELYSIIPLPLKDMLNACDLDNLAGMTGLLCKIPQTLYSPDLLKDMNRRIGSDMNGFIWNSMDKVSPALLELVFGRGINDRFLKDIVFNGRPDEAERILSSIYKYKKMGISFLLCGIKSIKSFKRVTKKYIAGYWKHRLRAENGYYSKGNFSQSPEYRINYTYYGKKILKLLKRDVNAVENNKNWLQVILHIYSKKPDNPRIENAIRNYHAAMSILEIPEHKLTQADYIWLIAEAAGGKFMWMSNYRIKADPAEAEHTPLTYINNLYLGIDFTLLKKSTLFKYCGLGPYKQSRRFVRAVGELLKNPVSHQPSN